MGNNSGESKLPGVGATSAKQMAPVQQMVTKYVPKTLIGCSLALGLALSLHANPLVQTEGSWDGPGQNLEYYFAQWGVTSGIGNTVNPALNYLNTGQLNGSSNWESALVSGSSATMLLEVAGNANYNEFGIYQGSGSSISYTQYFNGPDTTGATANLTIPSGNFGFYLEYYPTPTYFYSDDNLYPSGQGQLAVYQGPVGGTTITVSGVGTLPWNSNDYILAWEDLPYPSSDQDFNDMVIYVQNNTANAPDGGSTALLVGAGLAILAMARRKQRAVS
jgi:Domain of unknown function (DUF4114)/VPDSG-CTERM motif